MKEKIKPLYQVRYRNRSHARMDFGDFMKNLNKSLKEKLPADKQIRVQVTDHFLDRLMDRSADPEYIKKIVSSTFERNLCEIFYFMHSDHIGGVRMCFTDQINHIQVSYDRDRGVFTLRTFIHNPERHEAKLNPEFTIYPFRKQLGDNYVI